MIDDARFRLLISGRWLIPLMAHLAETRGSRFAVMLRQLGLSRSALTASLDLLAKQGWVVRNSGHGHPLRPEYVLTEAGLEIAAFCSRVMATRSQLGLSPSQLSRWSLPVVSRLSGSDQRFTPLRMALAPEITA